MDAAVYGIDDQDPRIHGEPDVTASLDMQRSLVCGYYRTSCSYSVQFSVLSPRKPE